MIHHTCIECQRGFVATSFDEAQEDFETTEKDQNETFEDLVKDNRLAYARYCPYCGGKGVRAI